MGLVVEDLRLGSPRLPPHSAVADRHGETALELVVTVEDQRHATAEQGSVGQLRLGRLAVHALQKNEEERRLIYVAQRR